MSAKRKPRRSLRQSIDAFCRACIYDPKAEGSCARQIRECTSTRCPLFLVRPK